MNLQSISKHFNYTKITLDYHQDTTSFTNQGDFPLQTRSNYKHEKTKEDEKNTIKVTN